MTRLVDLQPFEEGPCCRDVEGLLANEGARQCGVVLPWTPWSTGHGRQEGFKVHELYDHDRESIGPAQGADRRFECGKQFLFKGIRIVG